MECAQQNCMLDTLLLTFLSLCDFYLKFQFQILYAKDADQRSSTFERSIMMGQEYQRRTRMLILRSAMLKNHIHVKVILI